jgi:hypothetical protein
MALAKCSECDGAVSDRANACPHCGCPVNSGLTNPHIVAQEKRVPENLSTSSPQDAQNAQAGAETDKVDTGTNKESKQPNLAILLVVPLLLAGWVAVLIRNCNYDDQGNSRQLTQSGGIESKTGLISVVQSGADHYGAILAAYGKPERDDSTEYDDPRPLLVTRILEYRPENVKIVYCSP